MANEIKLREYLATRRSVILPFLHEPGPNKAELEEILTLGTRVPDHGKLAPWRLVVYQGDARQKAGERLAEIAKAANRAFTKEMETAEKNQFLPAPLTIGVISSPDEHPKIRQFEQLLSAGAVAFNIYNAANALGYGAHWVTRWFAYDPKASAMLGAKPGEQFVGFIHIGTPSKRLEERDRPKLADIVSYWDN
ncbi:hypothetical protein MNBD_ALPHA12-844 [hydrothermal vent metagenome]|uniref:Nitroreductase domain-containing protein n=1 Tax=hydrothermal vent metagenome TaxID=652676 RepID=A0A3B0TN39_9ZZZZ